MRLVDERTEAVRVRGPGRVNLIGEHTDYNSGLALPFAIDRSLTVTAIPDGGDRVTTASDGARPFLRGALGELEAMGVRPPGARIEVAGDLPAGAGLSSSAALSAGLALALIDLAGAAEPDRLELARLCSRIENDWVGARTGLLDQIAVLMAPPDGALMIDFATLATTPVSLDLGVWTLAVLDSGERHAHASGGYNERREECARGDPRRMRHVESENERVRAAVAALHRAAPAELGEILDASHASLRDDFEVSTPAVESARERMKAAGAAGARIMGGGFGGSVLALFPPGATPPPDAEPVAPAAPARVLR